jgi:hypothetical protein
MRTPSADGRGSGVPLPIPDDQVLVAQAAAALSADDAGDVSEILGELGVDFVLVGLRRRRTAELGVRGTGSSAGRAHRIR